MHPDTTHRGRLLYVALGFLGLDVPPAVMPPGLRALHAWFDTWHGIGLIAQGLARQDRDLSLTRYRDRWGASVFVTGREHSIVQGTGSPDRGPHMSPVIRRDSRPFDGFLVTRSRRESPAKLRCHCRCHCGG